MFLNRFYKWIANGGQEDLGGKPSNLEYWVGYQICKAYYEQTQNKTKAIYEMLHIQDHKKFLEESKIEEKFKKI